MRTVRLKNGTNEVVKLVKMTMFNLREMMNSEPMVILELVEKCRYDAYIFWGDFEQRLKDRSLILPNGRVHQSIKNVVLSAFEGEGMDIVLVDPIKE